MGAHEINDTLYWSSDKKLPDAATFPYARLYVPVLRVPSRYGSIIQNCVTEYVIYEEERVRFGDGPEQVFWKEAR